MNNAISLSFVDKLQVLKELIIQGQNILCSYGFIQDSCHHPHEINFNLFSVNTSSEYAGNFYNNSKVPLTIWLGYYEYYGFCIAFWSSELSVKDFIIHSLGNKKKECLCDYTGFETKNVPEGHWIHVPLKEGKKISRKELKEILEIINEDYIRSITNSK